MNTYLRTHHIIRLIDGIRVIAPGALNSSAARDFLVAHRDQSALVNGGQDPRKDGGAKFFGMTFANELAAPYRRPLGGNQRPGGKRCQRRKPPEAGAEGPR